MSSTIVIGKAAFSRGPWRRVDRDNGTTIYSNGLLVATVQGACHTSYSGPVTHDEYERAKEVKANADLIAAAPDLYEALTAFLSVEYTNARYVIENGPGGTDAEQDAHETIAAALAKAEAALAKVEGGAQ